MAGEGVMRDSCHTERFTTNSDGCTVVREGQAEVVFPSREDVFYNPVQEFNRDLSIAVIQAHADEVEVEGGIKILEALAASGLRSVRFAKELRGIESVVANDWSRQAVESITRNVKHNGLDSLVKPHNGDAAMLMYGHRRPEQRFHVIDLDPYGSPTPFLDSAVQAVSEGGLLCVTATDMAVLAGNSPETCHAKYGAVSLKTKSCHEFALRILLQCIESHANRYGRYIEPLLSLSIDFYCRVFVKVRTGQRKCKESTSKLGQVYQCFGCESLAFQPLGRTSLSKDGTNLKFSLPHGPPVDKNCKHCSHSHHIGGPIWLAPIHNTKFVEQLLDSLPGHLGTLDRLVGMLTMVLEELEDVPLYYELTRVCNITKQSTGKLTTFLSAVLNAGYRVSLTHANRNGIKTDAPPEFLWQMMRAWSKREGKETSWQKNLSEGTPGRIIMSSPSPEDKKVSFEDHPDANPKSREKGLKRFQMNPEPNWGPKNRSKTSLLTNSENSKKIKNQGRKKKITDEEEAASKKVKVTDA